jgi:hypothetical protein
MQQAPHLMQSPSPTLPRKRERERTAQEAKGIEHKHQPACSCCWQCAQTPEISITGAFGAKPAARAALLS